MRKLISIVIVSTLLLSASLAWAQSRQESRNQGESDHHAHDHTDSQQDETSKTLPEEKPRKDNTGPHGGTVQQVGVLQVETLIEPGGLRLFITDHSGKALDLSGARGLATLHVEGDAKRYRYDLFPDTGENKQAGSMAVAVDFSRIAGRDVEVAYQLVGVQGERRPLHFSVAASVPMTEAQKMAAAIEAQKVCPVSGQPLGAMGKPIAVAAGDRTIYVCCEGCIESVQEEPEKYLEIVFGASGTVPPGSEEVRPGVFEVVAADQPFISAQQKCPVMDEALDGMGGPYKVHANGKAIYICCPGCAKKIIAEPTKYLEVLSEQGIHPPELKEATHAAVTSQGEEVRPGIFKVTAADKPFVQAQKLCPVMDEPLDGMGGPYRTDVAGRVVYLCCPGCAKKLRASPDKFLEKLANQGVTPPVAQ